jgi:hypothetical protein
MLGFAQLLRAGHVRPGSDAFDECLHDIVTSGEEMLAAIDALDRVADAPHSQ